MRILFVSVNRTFVSDMNLAELEPWVASGWAITVSRAQTSDRVVAVFEGEPVAAWRVRGAFPSEETYELRTGDRRFRTALSLSEPLPILPQYREVPALRRGIAVHDIDVEPLPSER